MVADAHARWRTGLSRRHGLALLGVYLVILLLGAWVHDDAYITMRTVDHAVEGRGLVWNAGERVQVYTHPLWMLLLLPVYALVGSPWLSLLSLALVCSLAAVALLLGRVAGSSAGALLAAALLFLSRSFVDYSTSGLENPLLHLLLASFALVLVRAEQQAGERLGLLALITALGTLTRPDALLLFLPGLWLAWRQRLTSDAASNGRASAGPTLGSLLRSLPSLALGLMPLVLWMVFALCYYGSLAPNTAYAKLGTGVPLPGRWLQGLYYLLDGVQRDPAAVLAIVAAVALRRRLGALGPLALGAGLYLLYVVWIGGDYMGGRFLTGPLMASALALSRMPRPWPVRERQLVWIGGAVLIWLVGVSAFGLPVLMPGVGDERLRFVHATGLVPGLVQGLDETSWPDHLWRQRGEVLQQRGEKVWVHGFVGMLGYYSGPKVYVIDLLGLTDPLLARLPGIKRGIWNRPGRTVWTPGHLPRPLPEGYRETVASGRNQLADPRLAQVWQALAVVTRGPLWSRERWREIWRLQRGYYQQMLDSYVAEHAQRFATRPAKIEAWFSTDERPEGGAVAAEAGQ